MTHPGCIPAGFGPSAQVAHSVSGRYSFPCKGSAVRTSPQVWRYRKALAGWCGQARFVPLPVLVASMVALEGT